MGGGGEGAESPGVEQRRSVKPVHSKAGQKSSQSRMHPSGPMDLTDPSHPVKQHINPGDVAFRWLRSDWSVGADKEDGGI